MMPLAVCVTMSLYSCDKVEMYRSEIHRTYVASLSTGKRTDLFSM